MSANTAIPVDLNSGPSRLRVWSYIFAGLCASLVSIGLARFAYTPLLPALLQAHWFSAADTVYLGAANLAGYLAGAIVGRPLARQLSNRLTLRLMMLLVTLAFFACAYPLSVAWFFVWRFISGVSGGTIMVLVAATVLPHIPGTRKHLATGAIFLGLGLGVAASGTVIPLLLNLGLQATWVGLGVLAAVLTAASWFGWPPAAAPAHQHKASDDLSPPALGWSVKLFYVQYGLMALGFVPAMVFLVDFIARGLGAGAHVGAIYWVLYGIGAIAGPPLYGLIIDRLGARPALKAVFVVQALAMLALYIVSNPIAVAVITLIIGTFPPGLVPLALARVHEEAPLHPQIQNLIWSRATILFAACQAIAGYGYSALFNSSGQDYRLLFILASLAFVLALLIELANRKPKSNMSWG